MILKAVFIFFGVTTLAGLFIYLLFFANFFDVRNIKIDENSAVKEEVLKVADGFLSNKRLWLPARLNLLFLNKHEMESLILDVFPGLESAVINKKLLHELEIHTQERKTIGIWCFKKDDKCFYFDKYGVAFEEAPQSSGLIFLHVDDFRRGSVKLKEEVIESEWLGKFFQSKEELEKNLGIKVKNIIIPADSYDEFNILTHYGWELKLAKNLDISFQIKSLKIFINQKLTPEKLKSLQYIDARIENRFYYK